MIVRSAIGISLALLIACSTNSSPQADAVGPPAERPNVLIIVTDDQRGGLNVMPTTRHRFVDRGRRYPNSFVTTPQCCPSRASILTGRFTHNHDVVNNFSSAAIDPETMLQHHLQNEGYRTAAFGKFLNEWGTKPVPYFDTWTTFVGLEDVSYRDVEYNVNGEVKTIPGYSTRVLGSRAIRFLENMDDLHEDEPWMLYMAPVAPHMPTTPQDRYLDSKVPAWNGNPAVFEDETAEGRSDKPAFVRAENNSFAERSRFRERQFRTLMSVDDMVERIFRTMSELEERDTIAFFLSDNGILWGEHGLRGKAVPYTQAVHAPFFARWPGRLEPGSSDKRMVANIDVTPTVLDAVGIDTTEMSLDGRSLLDPEWDRDRMLLEFFGPSSEDAPPWASIRTQEEQYVEYYGDGDEVIFEEYYDLVEDPWQLNNLLGDSNENNDPESQPSLHEQLQQDRSCNGDGCP